jgi:ribose transport system substrate-binding protein
VNIIKIVKNLAASAAALAFASTVLAADPEWFPKNAKKPLAKMTIGFSSAGAAINSYVATYQDEFKKYAAALGVNAIILDAQVDPAKQADQIQNMVAQQVDALVVWPVNGKAVVPAVRQAHAAGIPVVITNSNIDPSGEAFIKAFSGPDDFTEGKTSGQLMAKALGDKGNVVMIDGLPGYTVTKMRHDGFMEGIKGSQIKILDAQPANFSQEKSQALMETYITRFGDQIDGVWTVEAGSGAGALTAVRAAIKEGKIKAGKIKMTDATIFAGVYDAIKAGDYYGSVWQSPADDSHSALKTAILAVVGAPLQKLVYFNTPAITKGNIDKFPRPNF